jgi:hypothetical protein
MDAIEKRINVDASSANKAYEIDDDIFKLPEKSNLPIKNLSDEENTNDFDEEIDDEIIHLTDLRNSAAVSTTIDFNSYFMKNQLEDSDTFFKVDYIFYYGFYFQKAFTWIFLFVSKINNIDKEVFESLPAEIQMEYLSNYKGLIKSKKSENFEEFPEVIECSF